MPKEHDNKILPAECQDHFSKEQLKHMLKNRNLPFHLLEIYELAKSFWYHKENKIIRDNYHIQKAIREDGV